MRKLEFYVSKDTKGIYALAIKDETGYIYIRSNYSIHEIGKDVWNMLKGKVPEKLFDPSTNMVEAIMRNVNNDISVLDKTYINPDEHELGEIVLQGYHTQNEDNTVSDQYLNFHTDPKGDVTKENGLTRPENVEILSIFSLMSTHANYQ